MNLQSPVYMSLQGNLIEPMLFIKYINDIVDTAQYSTISLCVYDSKLFGKSNNIKDSNKSKNNPFYTERREPLG